MVQHRSKVTMSDIARESGVSLSTVSLALNHKPGLPAETREKVTSTARALGYALRSPAPSGEHPASLGAIALLVRRAQGHPGQPSADIFFSYVMAGVEAGCRAQNLTLLYETLPVDEYQAALEVPRVIADARVDGVILAGGGLDERLHAALRQRGIPAVLVEGSAPGDLYDAVTIENEEGAYQAARYLLDKGHQQIAFLGGGPDAPVSLRDRRQGYTRALAERQLPPIYGDCPHNHREAVLATTCCLLSEHPQLSALLSCTDEAAIIALHAARMAGKRVPQDLSLVGFDDIAAAENAQPPLTTMQVDKISLGRLAVQLIINRAESPHLGRVTMHLHASLIERQSVRDIRAALPESESAVREAV